MDPHFGEMELFSNDIVKEEVMDSEEGQTRLSAGKDEKWPGKEEIADSPVIKEEVEDEEIWRYGGSSTKKKKPDFDKNPEAKRRKWTPAIEDNDYTTQPGLNSEVKEETEPFPTAVIGHGSLPSFKLLSDNQVFNAHDFFTNQAMVKGEINEDEEEGIYQTAYDDDSENPNEKKMCPVDKCPEECDSDEALRMHMTTHPKPMPCGVCKGAWPNAAALRAHHRIHSGEKPFQCPTCERKFTQASTLKVHMRQHTGEHPFECDTCERKYTDASALKYHQTTHTGEKPFACTLCAYRSASSGSLKVHMRTHTGDKSFECILCDFRSASSGDLTKHMRTHTGEKPFECSDCDQCFSRREHLERHKACVHMGIKKYSCPDCDHKSARQSNLSDHIRRKHKK